MQTIFLAVNWFSPHIISYLIIYYLFGIQDLVV